MGVSLFGHLTVLDQTIASSKTAGVIPASYDGFHLLQTLNVSLNSLTLHPASSRLWPASSLLFKLPTHYLKLIPLACVLASTSLCRPAVAMAVAVYFQFVTHCVR